MTKYKYECIRRIDTIGNIIIVDFSYPDFTEMLAILNILKSIIDRDIDYSYDINYFADKKYLSLQIVVLKPDDRTQNKYLYMDMHKYWFKFKQEITDYEQQTVDRNTEKLWEKLTDIPFDEIDNELVLAVKFYIWESGTDRDYIWQWFDNNHSKGVHYLLYGYTHIE